MRMRIPQTKGMMIFLPHSRQARYVKKACIAPELRASRNGKGASHLVCANGDQRPKFSTKRYWMKTWGSSLARRMASCHRNKQQDEERTTPTHRYTVTPALRRIAKMTTALVHRESFFWYLTYVMAEVSIGRCFRIMRTYSASSKRL